MVGKRGHKAWRFGLQRQEAHRCSVNQVHVESALEKDRRCGEKCAAAEELWKPPPWSCRTSARQLPPFSYFARLLEDGVGVEMPTRTKTESLPTVCEAARHTAAMIETLHEYTEIRRTGHVRAVESARRDGDCAVPAETSDFGAWGARTHGGCRASSAMLRNSRRFSKTLSYAIKFCEANPPIVPRRRHPGRIGTVPGCFPQNNGIGIPEA